jgi:hypothetical protein
MKNVEMIKNPTPVLARPKSISGRMSENIVVSPWVIMSVSLGADPIESEF